jgi:hypothetical protein
LNLTKIRRFDIALALRRGTATHFHVAHITHSIILYGLAEISELRGSRKGLLGLTGLAPELRELAIDTVNLTSLLSNKSQSHRLDPCGFEEALISICCRLIGVHPIGSSQPIDQLDELCQLSMIAFMASLLLEYSRQSSSYELVSEKLGIALRRVSQTDSHDETMLWCLFIGAIAVFDLQEDRWLRPLLSKTCARIHLHSWTEVRSVLVSFCWIDAVHERLGKAVWDFLSTTS